jgi:hypothetical protein
MFPPANLVEVNHAVEATHHDTTRLLVRTARNLLARQSREFGDFMDHGRGVLGQSLLNPFTDVILEITVIKTGSYTSFTLLDRQNNILNRYHEESEALNAISEFMSVR